MGVTPQVCVDKGVSSWHESVVGHMVRARCRTGNARYALTVPSQHNCASRCASRAARAQRVQCTARPMSTGAHPCRVGTPSEGHPVPGRAYPWVEMHACPAEPCPRIALRWADTRLMAAVTTKIKRSGPAIRSALAESAPTECEQFESEFAQALAQAAAGRRVRRVVRAERGRGRFAARRVEP